MPAATIATSNLPDWNQVWKMSRLRKSGVTGKSRRWNNRAASFARNTEKSTYARNFISMLQPKKSDTVLDIGCGPGTLVFPLSPLVKTITALDISERMIGKVHEGCNRQGISNVTAKTISWQDNWDEADIDSHDIVIASRSMVEDDLELMITKMDGRARKRAYISSLVGDGPFDRRIFEAMGRKLDRGPDYLCIYNMLNQMGILAEVTFISSDAHLRLYQDIEDAIASIGWMTGPLTLREESRLFNYFWKHLTLTPFGWALDYQHTARWAIISWQHPVVQ